MEGTRKPQSWQSFRLLSVVYSKCNLAEGHFLRQSPKTCFQRRETQRSVTHQLLGNMKEKNGSCFFINVRFLKSVLLSVGPKKLPREKRACVGTPEILMSSLHFYDNTVLLHCKLLVLELILLSVGKLKQSFLLEAR